MILTSLLTLIIGFIGGLSSSIIANNIHDDKQAAEDAKKPVPPQIILNVDKECKLHRDIKAAVQKTKDLKNNQ